MGENTTSWGGGGAAEELWILRGFFFFACVFIFFLFPWGDVLDVTIWWTSFSSAIVESLALRYDSLHAL